MKTASKILNCIEKLISYMLRKAASSISFAAVLEINLIDLVLGIVGIIICGLILGLFVLAVVSVVLVGIIILLVIISLIPQNRIPIKTMKGLVSGDGFLQRVEVGVNP